MPISLYVYSEECTLGTGTLINVGVLNQHQPGTKSGLTMLIHLSFHFCKNGVPIIKAENSNFQFTVLHGIEHKGYFSIMSIIFVPGNGVIHLAVDEWPVQYSKYRSWLHR